MVTEVDNRNVTILELLDEVLPDPRQVVDGNARLRLSVGYDYVRARRLAFRLGFDRRLM